MYNMTSPTCSNLLTLTFDLYVTSLTCSSLQTLTFNLYMTSHLFQPADPDF